MEGLEPMAPPGTPFCPKCFNMEKWHMPVREEDTTDLSRGAQTARNQQVATVVCGVCGEPLHPEIYEKTQLWR